MRGRCKGTGAIRNTSNGPGGQWASAECPGCPDCWTAEDWRVLHQAVGMAVTVYDAVEEESGVPEDAPLYGKRDRLVELARQLDHEANHAALPSKSASEPSTETEGLV